MGICECCSDIFRDEFKLKSCLLEHTPPEDLVKSQWQSKSKNLLYLIYRWIAAGFFISAVTVAMTDFPVGMGFFFIYLTNWGILMCLITTVFGAIIVTRWHFQEDFSTKISQSNQTCLAFKVYWCLHNTTLVISLIITLIYWIILHDSNIFPVNAPNVMTHACNSIVMFFDVLIVAYPIRLYHVIQPIAFGLIYTIFSVIYFVSGGKDLFGNSYIYPVLDWNKPEYAIVTMIGTVLLATICHFLLFWIYQLRSFIHRKYFEPKLYVPTTAGIGGVAGSTASVSMIFSANDNGAFDKSTMKINESV